MLNLFLYNLVLHKFKGQINQKMKLYEREKIKIKREST